MLQRDALSLVGGVSRSSRFCITFSLELGGESPVLLLSSNSASMGHLNVVGGCGGGRMDGGWFVFGDR